MGGPLVGYLHLWSDIWAGSRTGLYMDGTQNTWKWYVGACNEKPQIMGDVGGKYMWSRLESSRSFGLEEDRYLNCAFDQTKNMDLLFYFLSEFKLFYIILWTLIS